MKLTNRQLELISKQISTELEKEIPEFNEKAFIAKLSKLEKLKKELVLITKDIVTSLEKDNPKYSNIRVYENSNGEGYYVSKRKPSYYSKVKDELELACIDATTLESIVEKVKTKASLWN